MGHFVLAFLRFLGYCVFMIKNGIALIKSVKADIVALQEMLSMPHVDSDQQARVRDLIAKNEAWLAEFELQDKVAMRGNVNK